MRWFGEPWMLPVAIEFEATKVGASSVVAKLSCAVAESKAANATSDGELVRVGTVTGRVVSESFGKTR